MQEVLGKDRVSDWLGKYMQPHEMQGAGKCHEESEGRILEVKLTESPTAQFSSSFGARFPPIVVPVLRLGSPYRTTAMIFFSRSGVMFLAAVLITAAP
jgi:hypothetical protein